MECSNCLPYGSLLAEVNFSWPTVPARPLAGNFLDKSLHRHSLRDQAGSCMIHRSQQAPARLIDARNVPHVDLDLFAAGLR
jgi:hypothetical protein